MLSLRLLCSTHAHTRTYAHTRIVIRTTAYNIELGTGLNDGARAVIHPQVVISILRLKCSRTITLFVITLNSPTTHRSSMLARDVLRERWDGNDKTVRHDRQTKEKNTCRRRKKMNSSWFTLVCTRAHGKIKPMTVWWFSAAAVVGLPRFVCTVPAQAWTNRLIRRENNNRSALPRRAPRGRPCDAFGHQVQAYLCSDVVVAGRLLVVVVTQTTKHVYTVHAHGFRRKQNVRRFSRSAVTVVFERRSVRVGQPSAAAASWETHGTETIHTACIQRYYGFKPYRRNIITKLKNKWKSL